MRETPGPIPNPEAKPYSADGTALVTVWESRTPPDKHCGEAPDHQVRGFSASGTGIPAHSLVEVCGCGILDREPAA